MKKPLVRHYRKMRMRYFLIELYLFSVRNNDIFGRQSMKMDKTKIFCLPRAEDVADEA
jgi:hypothetical protein